MLDQIAAALHSIPAGRPAKPRQRPPWDRMGDRGPPSPDRGYYTVVDPLLGVDQQPYSGSMADDLLDLGNTMVEALWRLETLGPDDAHWFLRALQHHWELHLRELSLYLYAKRFR